MFYSSGTVALIEGATALTFAGTDLIANVKIGDEFLAPGGSARVVSIEDGTHLTIYPPWRGDDGATASYKIARGSGWSSVAEVNQRYVTLIQSMVSGIPWLPPTDVGLWGANGRDKWDGAEEGFRFLEFKPLSDPSLPAARFSYKLSDDDGDWSAWADFTGPSGDDGATVEEVLAALGVNSITISTSNPTGGENNDVWFKVPA